MKPHKHRHRPVHTIRTRSWWQDDFSLERPVLARLLALALLLGLFAYAVCHGARPVLRGTVGLRPMPMQWRGVPKAAFEL